MSARKETVVVPQFIEVTYRQLADAVAVVKPHAGTDATLPMLTGIKFETKDGALELAATDRYTLGIARIEHDAKSELAPFGEFSALISVKEIARVLTIFKPARYNGLPFGLRITIEDGRAVFEMTASWSDLAGSKLSVKLIDSKFPPVDTLIKPLVKDLAAATDQVAFTAFNPNILARFNAIHSVSRGTPVELRQSSPTKPLLITAHTDDLDFVGVAMPMRLPEGDTGLARLQERYPTPEPVVAEPEPVAKPAARKPRARKAKAT
jgi:DNA polymerase III sliding clamp (beta) subunit (PCNA family)